MKTPIFCRSPREILALHRLRHLIMSFLMSMMVLPVFPQSGQGMEGRIELDTARDLRKQAEQDASLEGEVSTRISAPYDKTIGALEIADRSEARVTNFRREQTEIDHRIGPGHHCSVVSYRPLEIR